MANYSRTDRVSEEVKRELSAVIRELKDPRLPVMVTVVAVNVTKDLKFAKAHISIMGNEEVKNNALAALKSASGFIRREIRPVRGFENIPVAKSVFDLPEKPDGAMICLPSRLAETAEADASCTVKMTFTPENGESYTLVDYASAGKDWQSAIAAWLPTRG